MHCGKFEVEDDNEPNALDTAANREPVWGNCRSAFAPAAKVNSPRNLVSRLRKSNDRFGLEAVIRCMAALKDWLNVCFADNAAVSCSWTRDRF